jgi:hypothetical protein
MTHGVKSDKIINLTYLLHGIRASNDGGVNSTSHLRVAIVFQSAISEHPANT